MKDGSFWVSDEYGPYIIHFDSTGKMIEKISPAAKSILSHKFFHYENPTKEWKE